MAVPQKLFSRQSEYRSPVSGLRSPEFIIANAVRHDDERCLKLVQTAAVTCRYCQVEPCLEHLVPRNYAGAYVIEEIEHAVAECGSSRGGEQHLDAMIGFQYPQDVEQSGG